MLVRTLICLISTLLGAILNWTGVWAVAAVLAVLWFIEIVRYPWFAPLGASSAYATRDNYVGAYALALMLLFLSAYLSHKFGIEGLWGIFRATFMRS
jgi:Kef-type K+ transport system membrane component KefB